MVCSPDIRPGGAAECSHGWSFARCQAGGAQPVDSFAPQPSRPGGAEGASRGKQNAKEHPQTCSAYRPLVNATRESVAPPGRKGDDVPVFHGFRVGPLRGPDAPPPATTRRPSGARASNGQGKSWTCPTWLPVLRTPADTVTDPIPTDGVEVFASPASRRQEANMHLFRPTHSCLES